MHELGFRRDGLRNMRVHLGLIAAWVGASVLLAEVREQELVVPGPLGAVHATPRCGHKLRVPLVERRMFEDEQDVLLNPRLQIADGEQDALGLLPAVAPVLAEASSERLFLLVGLELRQQERMSDADLLAVEGFDRCRGKLGQLQACATYAGALPVFAAICSMLYFGSSKSRRALKPCASSIG